MTTSPCPDSETLHRLYFAEGLTPTMIGARYNVQAQTARKWLRADGVRLPSSPPPTTQRRYTPPSEDDLRDLYHSQRLTSTQIAERFGVSKGLVLQWLRLRSIPRRRNGTGLESRGIEPPSTEDLDRMINDERLTYSQIAVQFGVDQSAVQYWLRKHDITRPPTWIKAHDNLESVAAMRTAYEAGASLEDVGQHWDGVAGTTVARLFKMNGIPLRTDGWKGGKRFACKDGHAVRSTYEQRVDDWLYEHGVDHIYEPQLPFSPMHKADFLANGYYIEVWGVTHNPAYQERKQQKITLYAANRTPLIEIPHYAFAKAQNNLWIRRLHLCLNP